MAFFYEENEKKEGGCLKANWLSKQTSTSKVYHFFRVKDYSPSIISKTKDKKTDRQ
jgi:hypothetical protein